MGIKLSIRPLDRQPFYHGYGMECSQAELIVAIWDMSVTDMHGTMIKIPFYVTKGLGFLLLGNEILHKSRLLGPENALVIPAGACGLSQREIILQTYSEQIFPADKKAKKTYLFVVPFNTSSSVTYFASFRSLMPKENSHPFRRTKFMDGKVAKRFALKLHGSSQLPLEDMLELCKRGAILSPVFRQALRTVTSKCTSCKSTGRPSNSRKVSFGKLLTTINDQIQLDYMIVTELGNQSILHIVDVHTGRSVTALMSSREMEEASRVFDNKWCNVHGPPAVVSSDPEFNNSVFKSFLQYVGAKLQPRPAQRHNKLGVVESKNAVVCLIAQRMTKDAQFFIQVREMEVEKSDVLSRATYISNILYGNKGMTSSFELARGYTPSIAGLSKSVVSEEILAAHEEQLARRALFMLNKGRSPNTVDPLDIRSDVLVYYFKRNVKFGIWETGYVRTVDPRMVVISNNPEHRGMPIRAANEDVRIAPRSPVLLDLDQIGYVFPRSYSVVDTDDAAIANSQQDADDSQSRPQALPVDDGLPACFPWEYGNDDQLPHKKDILGYRGDSLDSRALVDGDAASYFREDPAFCSIDTPSGGGV